MNNFKIRYSRIQMGVRSLSTKAELLNTRFADRVEHFLGQNKKAEVLVLLRWGALVDASIASTGFANKFGQQPWQMTQSQPSKCPKKTENMKEDIRIVGDRVDLTKIFNTKYDEIVDLTIQDEPMKFEKIKVKKENSCELKEES